jgi:mannitol/fructose-specific phosphotransferase system IIA component (Ntr-type)
LVDEELREILIERDDVNEIRFEDLINKCEVIDIFKYERLDKFTWLIADRLADRLETDKDKLYALLKKREKDADIIVHPGIAIFSHVIKGRNKFEIILVRSKKGIIFSDDAAPVHAFFVIVASPDQQSYFLHSLMWIVQIAEETDFEEEWINARDVHELRDIILSSWKKRKTF